MKIAIIGAGAFGTTLGNILADNGYNIDYFDPKIDKPLGEVVENAKYVLLAIPSFAVEQVLPNLPKNIPLIVATKGLLTDNNFKEFSDYMIISGPGFARDINNHKKTYLTITDKRLEKLFETDYLIFDYSPDKKGVMMCGALKNVYAILAGYFSLKRRTNEWQDYIDSVTKEMYEILAANGADPKTFDLACGRGDLELTCDLPSRNYEFGLKVCENSDYKPEKTVEGLTTISKILRGDIIIPERAELLRKILTLSNEWSK